MIMTPEAPPVNAGSGPPAALPEPPPAATGLCPLEEALRAGDVLAAALAYREAGVSTFAIKANGTKEPAHSGWREYAGRRSTEDELHRWHSGRRPFGIGATGGSASGNLAALDFEVWSAFARWGAGLSAIQRKHLDRCPVVRTPKGGAHVHVRTAEPVPGMKLARTAAGETVIEVRGKQHYVVLPGSPSQCHPSGRPYLLLRPGWFDGGPFEAVPLDVWFELTVAAAELNEYRKPAPREVVGDRGPGAAAGDRPGDHFNARVGWGDILSPHGWRVFRSTESATFWTRPGKKEGISASTGFCRGPSGGDLLYVFSTSAAPFDAEVSYSKFAAYALLSHGGDFRAATRALGLAGYGKPLQRASVAWKGASY